MKLKIQDIIEKKIQLDDEVRNIGIIGADVKEIRNYFKFDSNVNIYRCTFLAKPSNEHTLLTSADYVVDIFAHSDLEAKEAVRNLILGDRTFRVFKPIQNIDVYRVDFYYFYSLTPVDHYSIYDEYGYFIAYDLRFQNYMINQQDEECEE